MQKSKARRKATKRRLKKNLQSAFKVAKKRPRDFR